MPYKNCYYYYSSGAQVVVIRASFPYCAWVCMAHTLISFGSLLVPSNSRWARYVNKTENSSSRIENAQLTYFTLSSGFAFLKTNEKRRKYSTQNSRGAQHIHASKSTQCVIINIDVSLSFWISIIKEEKRMMLCDSGSTTGIQRNYILVGKCLLCMDRARYDDDVCNFSENMFQ